MQCEREKANLDGSRSHAPPVRVSDAGAWPHLPFPRVRGSLSLSRRWHVHILSAHKASLAVCHRSALQWIVGHPSQTLLSPFLCHVHPQTGLLDDARALDIVPLGTVPSGVDKPAPDAPQLV